jgi:drug/metabolite transporter (DMT)-like permease
VLQRGLGVGAATQVTGSAFFGLVTLLVFVVLSERRKTLHAFLSIRGAGLAVAVCNAIASATFLVALNYTSVANVLLIQASAPLVAALIVWVAVRERVSRGAMLAMMSAAAGVAVMVGGPNSVDVYGLFLPLIVTVAYALGVVIMRHRSDISMAAALCLSQALILIFVSPFSHPLAGDRNDLLLLVVLGVGQTGLGMVFLTFGARLIPATEVTLIALIEVVLGSLWVWIAYSQRPSSWAFLGGSVVLAAVACQALGGRGAAELSLPGTP